MHVGGLRFSFRKAHTAAIARHLASRLPLEQTCHHSTRPRDCPSSAGGRQGRVPGHLSCFPGAGAGRQAPIAGVCTRRCECVHQMQDGAPFEVLRMLDRARGSSKITGFPRILAGAAPLCGAGVASLAHPERSGLAAGSGPAQVSGWSKMEGLPAD